jgi:hypothetical protein
MSRLALIPAALALIACPAAAAHSGGGAAKGDYHSTVERITPPVAGLTARILDGDDQLELANTAGRRIVVFGYDGEPYLLFTRNGVQRNNRSPATYLNDDRYGNVELPRTANAKAPPRWVSVAGGIRYAWHDHRIHWMSPIAPSAVRKAPDQPHHLFDWRVPADVDGNRVNIAGSLDFAPPGENGLPIWVPAIAGIAALGATAGAALLIARRRKKSKTRADSSPEAGAPRGMVL